MGSHARMVCVCVRVCYLSDHIPNWLIEFYYLLPVGWITRSVALNEYHSDRYTREDGDRQLGVYEFSTNEGYKWGGIGYVLGLVILINGLAVLAIKHARPMLSTGAKRVDSSPQTEGTDETAIRVQIVPPGSKPAATPSEQLPGSTASGALASLGGLSFQPLHLTFSDLSYTVQVTETDTATGQKRTVDRLLLQNLSGVLPAGSITALMGSSGAGKTTLLDVLAGRKNTGVVRGSINVNGTPQHLPTFGRQMAFAEQDDCHLSTATVREAVALSAALRLPASVTSAEREAFVESILVDLELDSIADRQVGTAGVEGSLAPGELKRVTLGVELAANPPLLLVDEPTSGETSSLAWQLGWAGLWTLQPHLSVP
jgi:ABC-type nitrate/sulfonate/bicarbonate transport system ATPase subunit